MGTYHLVHFSIQLSKKLYSICSWPSDLSGSFHHGYERLERSLSHQQIEIGSDDGEFIHCFGYQHSSLQSWIYWTASFIFFGVPTLLLSWYPQFAALRYKPCSLDSASIVLIRVCIPCISSIPYYLWCHQCLTWIQFLFCLVQDSNGICSLHEVHLISHLQPHSAIAEHVRVFSHRLLLFVWMAGKGFQRLRGLSNGLMTLASLLDSPQGLSKQEQNDL